MDTLAPPERGRTAPSAKTPQTNRSATAAALVLTTTAVLALAAYHLTQGTSSVGIADLWDLATGSGDDLTLQILTASRLPRVAAALAVGAALGASGLLLQSVARNKLASPDTLAVNAGAYLAVTASAAFGVSLPFLPGLGTAFLGALLTAGLVLLVSGGGTASTTRLILAGSAAAMAATALTNLLLILFQEKTTGLFAWGSGNLSQAGFGSTAATAGIVLAGLVIAVLLGGRLDVLRLGDDTASSLGVPVRRTRLTAIVVSLLLAACAVSIAGPVGFVGLTAPVIAAAIASRVPGLTSHRSLVPFAALTGMLVLLTADVLLRAALGAEVSLVVPVGVATTIVGAAVMIHLARRVTDPGIGSHSADVRTTGMGRVRYTLLVAGLFTAVVAAMFAGMLVGDATVLGGDIVNWLQRTTGPAYTFLLDQRFPRVLAAVLAGAALAVAGTVTQATCRNPLAEPGVLGVTGGASVGAVALITWAPDSGTWAIMGVATAGALLTFGLIYALAWRGGLSTARLVLIGIGLSAIAAALVVLIIVYSDPWNTPKVMTWLSGTTYGRTLERLAPVSLALLVIAPVLYAYRRDIDLLALDEDTPRLVGIRLERTRLLVLALSAVLAAAAVVTVGVVGFVGLVAPHMARAVVGSKTGAVMPVATAIGILLVSVADTLGRWVIAPAQVPAGLVCAMIGTPYFIYLLWRTRARS
ncbi:iron ABC transporter permease [Salininema proteolyticum]|uniref:Iron ABC transporter permease n=1 Tax=Salininema proteolyticum TaxID=1607685 RepID=A0ABV8TZT2_9ACTN